MPRHVARGPLDCHRRPHGNRERCGQRNLTWRHVRCSRPFRACSPRRVSAPRPRARRCRRPSCPSQPPITAPPAAGTPIVGSFFWSLVQPPPTTFACYSAIVAGGRMRVTGPRRVHVPSPAGPVAGHITGGETAWANRRPSITTGLIRAAGTNPRRVNCRPEPRFTPGEDRATGIVTW